MVARKKATKKPRRRGEYVGSVEGNRVGVYIKNERSAPKYLKNPYVTQKLFRFKQSTIERNNFTWDCTIPFLNYVTEIAKERGFVSGDAMLERMGISSDYFGKMRRGKKTCSYHYMFWIVSKLKEPITLYV